MGLHVIPGTLRYIYTHMCVYAHHEKINGSLLKLAATYLVCESKVRCYCRSGFNCEYLLNANCEFFYVSQLIDSQT